MAQGSIPHPKIVRFKGLGPGFWPVTAVLALLSIVSAVYFLFGSLDWLLPGASQPVADRASDIDGLFKFMAVFGNAIMIFVAGYVIYFSVVFRARKSDPPDMVGVPIHDAPALELWWTVIPSLLLVLLTGLSIAVWYKIQFGTAAPALTAEVIGHQFYFEYRYPGLKTSVYSKTEPMHLPVGVPVRLLITSADVIHQFWVPEIRLKAAGVPGLVQNLNFTPLRTGTYDIACSEFCGVDHSLMRSKRGRRRPRCGQGAVRPKVHRLPPDSTLRPKARRPGSAPYHGRPRAPEPGDGQDADARAHRSHPAERLHRADRRDAQPASQRAFR